MPSSIIQRMLHEHNVSDIRHLSDEKKLEICKQALRKITEGLVNRIPNDVPKRSLIQYGDALNEISITFSYLIKTAIGKRYKIAGEVLKKINRALVCVSLIKDMIRKNGDDDDYKTEAYYALLVEIREIAIEVYEHLKDE
jgi:hypothetical protein